MNPPRESLPPARHNAQIIVYLVLAPVHALLLAVLALHYSPTSDEVAHLAAGVRIFEQRAVDSYFVNPPFVKIVAAIPVILQQPHTDWKRFSEKPADRREWQVGQDFIYANGSLAMWYFVLARWACIPFSLLGLAVVFVWSSQLFGSRSGMFSAVLWTFSPTILGNAALITPDVACASFSIAAAFFFHRWLVTATWRNAGLAALILGLAQLTKMTCVVLWPSFLLAWLCWQRPTQQSFRQFACIVLGSLYIVNQGYLFQGSFQRLDEYNFTSVAFGGRPDTAPVVSMAEELTERNRFRGSWAGKLPVPFPEPYITGLDLQRRDFEGGWKPMHSYLVGEQRIGGWWYYYLYGMSVKLPLGLHWLLIATVGLMLTRQPALLRSFRDYGVITIPLLVFFVTVSSQTGFSRYFRYVLPCLPFLFVLTGQCFSAAGNSALGRRICTGLVCCFVVESLCVYPDSLAFFNVASGGVDQGHRHLLDSNVDWGQDLFRLKKWLNDNPTRRPLSIAYSGVVDPRVIGLEFREPPKEVNGTAPEIPVGYYAVSVNHIHGYDAPQNGWGYFLNFPVYYRISPSIIVYRIGNPEQNRTETGERSGDVQTP